MADSSAQDAPPQITGWIDVAGKMLSDQPVIAHGIIIRTKGSAPQVTGAHMLIGTDSIWQTIGGGALEYQLMLTARQAFDARAETQDSWHRQVMDIVLGPDVGQCCGGQVKILLEFYRRAEMDYLADLAISGGAIAHPLRSGQKPELLSDSTDMSARLTADSFILPQTVYRRPLFIYGAGHVGRALVHIASSMGFDIHWVDFDEDRFPVSSGLPYRQIIATDPAKLAAYAPQDAFHIIVTHSHQLDEAICHAVLGGSGFARCGLIGSKTKRARFHSRLSKLGISDDMLARLSCPVGLDLITSKQPQMVAISIAAQLAIWQEQGNNG
ncbi:MAG: xanthine dehydrogenase accessory protein XdhC [Candidatus Puniceispirillaceae bacterium]